MANNVESEAQKFDLVMRKILSVSHKELQKREKKYQRKRRNGRRDGDRRNVF